MMSSSQLPAVKKDILFGGHLTQIFGPSYFITALDQKRMGAQSCVVTSQKLFYSIASMQLLPPAQYETLHKIVQNGVKLFLKIFL